MLSLGLKFISEKVSHHPNWLACFAEGRGWEYTATESGQQKFWGRSMESKLGSHLQDEIIADRPLDSPPRGHSRDQTERERRAVYIQQATLLRSQHHGW